MDSEADGYLSAYDDDVAGALELLAHDLAVTLGWTREYARKRVRSRSKMRAAAVGPEFGGEHVLYVAADIQGDLHDLAQSGLGTPATNTWPACPRHRNHPLWLEPELSPNAAWTCPMTDERVARLGKLSAHSSSDQ